AKLAELVPVAKSKVNKYFRAYFYNRAGLEANRAAALTVGTDGFSAEKPCPAAVKSMQYWTEFKKNNDRDMTASTLHNYCLALAYNRKAIEAFEALKVDSKFFPLKAEFFYDQSRICAVAAEEFVAEIKKQQVKDPFGVIKKSREDQL